MIGISCPTCFLLSSELNTTLSSLPFQHRELKATHSILSLKIAFGIVSYLLTFKAPASKRATFFFMVNFLSSFLPSLGPADCSEMLQLFVCIPLIWFHRHTGAYPRGAWLSPPLTSVISLLSVRLLFWAFPINAAQWCHWQLHGPSCGVLFSWRSPSGFLHWWWCSVSSLSRTVATSHE